MFKPGSSHTKDSKILLDAALLNIQHFKIRVQWSNPGNGVVLIPYT